MHVRNACMRGCTPVCLDAPVRNTPRTEAWERRPVARPNRARPGI